MRNILLLSLILVMGGLHTVRADPNWVISFTEQRQCGIWDGRAIRTIAYLEREYDKVQKLRLKVERIGRGSSNGLSSIYPGEKPEVELYINNGHYYTFRMLEKAIPDFFYDVKQAYNKRNAFVEKMLMYSIEGEVFQHTSETILLVESYSEDDIVALELPLNHSLFRKADGESFSLFVKGVGTYEYQSTSGSLEVVKKFTELSGTEKKEIENERKIINEEIERLEGSYPPEMALSNFLWYTYCKGIEADLEKGLIEPHGDCLNCNGTGKEICSICSGRGKGGSYFSFIDVIESDSFTRRELRRMELQKKKSQQRSMRESAQKKRDGIRESLERELSITRSMFPEKARMVPFIPDLERERKERESAYRANKRKTQKQVESEIKGHKLEKKKRRENNIKCPVCKGNGWIGCPECVLVDKPKYKTSAKAEYINRWNKKTNR